MALRQSDQALYRWKLIVVCLVNLTEWNDKGKSIAKSKKVKG
jgi:hypothetical protein